MKTALGVLLGEASEQAFLSDVFERRFQTFPGAIDTDERPALFRLDCLDTIFSTADLRDSRVEIVREGSIETPPRLGSGETDRLQCLDLLREGASLLMRNLQSCCPEAMRFAHKLSIEIGGNVHINAYLTPPAGSALKPHFDDHDVFIVQCFGEKEWKLNERYERHKALPNLRTRASAEDQRRDSDPATETTLTLREGDVLYMPRGILHSAVAGTCGSVHLTIGFMPITWADLLRNAITYAERRDVRFREAVHPRLCRRPVEDDPQLSQKFRDLLQEMDFAKSASATRARFGIFRAAPVDGLLSDIFRPMDIEETVWALRASGCHSLRCDETGAATGIAGHGRQLTFGEIEKRLFARIQELREFRATDLGSEEQRARMLKFLRDLYQLGVLVPA